MNKGAISVYDLRKEGLEKQKEEKTWTKKSWKKGGQLTQFRVRFRWRRFLGVERQRIQTLYNEGELV